MRKEILFLAALASCMSSFAQHFEKLPKGENSKPHNLF